MFDHLEQFGTLAEEMLTNVRAATTLVSLIFAIHDYVHTCLKNAILVFLQQRIPMATPDYLDYIPASATEDAFQFLNDFAVAAYRSVETLQVAVDHEVEIAELFARRKADRTQ